MAFAVITLENKKTNQMKLAPVGYSWTNLFFGFFVPLIRGDWKWGIIFLAVGIVTWGFGSIITSFFYNKRDAHEPKVRHLHRNLPPHLHVRRVLAQDAADVGQRAVGRGGAPLIRH